MRRHVSSLLAGGTLAALLLAAGGCSVFHGSTEGVAPVRIATVRSVRTVYVNPVDEALSGPVAMPTAAAEAQTRFGSGPQPAGPQMPDQVATADPDSARRLEITVQLDDGELRAVLQPPAAQFTVGEQVKLVGEKGRVQVIH